MGRRAEHHTQVGSGERAQSVGYSTTARDGYLGVRFIGADGRRIERMTNSRAEYNRKTEQLLAPDNSYHIEAARIIAKAFAMVYPDPKRVTWDHALKTLAPDLRPDTHIAYDKAVRILRETLQEHGMAPASPAALTSELAAQFGPLWLSGTYKRGHAADAKTYKRQPTTLNFYLRQLSAVWELWRPQGYVATNVWKDVRKATTNTIKKRVPTHEEVETFFAWVRTRYPKWERLHALLDLKSLAGCRTADLCELRSDQLQGGQVVWSADQTKNRAGRSVPVSAALFDTLTRLAGPTFLWEGFVDDLARFRASRPRPVKSFDPESLAGIVANIFKEYGYDHPTQKHVTPHSLRRYRITQAAVKGYSLDETAHHIGLHAATARRYYADMGQASNAKAFFADMAGDIPEKTAHTIPTLKLNPEEPTGTNRNQRHGKKS